MFDFLSQKFSGILSWLKDKGRLSEENIAQATNQVREALLEADVPYDVIEAFLGTIKEEALNQKVTGKLNPGQHFIKIVHEKLLAFLGGSATKGSFSLQIPSVIMVMGLQGSGKTTSIAKLATWVTKEAKKRGKQRRILFASVDFYRPAAVEQLKILAEKVGVDFYASSYTNPVTAAKDIYAYVKKHHYEHLFLDTAGRLHIDEDMISELIAINKALEPKHKILVLDAMTGQESLNVARKFNTSVGFQGAILSKMDSETRAGAAFSFRYTLGKPIHFVGTGEKPDDLELFSPERMAKRMLGMGDILSLIEKAEENVNKGEQEAIAKRFMQGNFTLDDFAKQLDMVTNLGPLQKVMRYMPGGAQVSAEAIESSSADLKVFRAIISSMTLRERVFPDILDGSRRRRIAKGSGTDISDIKRLLERFEQSKQYVKMFKKMGRLKGLFR